MFSQQPRGAWYLHLVINGTPHVYRVPERSTLLPCNVTVFRKIIQSEVWPTSGHRILGSIMECVHAHTCRRPWGRTVSHLAARLWNNSIITTGRRHAAWLVTVAASCQHNPFFSVMSIRHDEEWNHWHDDDSRRCTMHTCTSSLIQILFAFNEGYDPDFAFNKAMTPMWKYPNVSLRERVCYHVIHNMRHDTSASNNSCTTLNATVRCSPELLSSVWTSFRTRVPRRVRLLELSPFVLLGRTRGAVTTATSGGELCSEQSARYLNLR